MKPPTTKKILPIGTLRAKIGTPPVHYRDVPGEEYERTTTFFGHTMKTAGVTQKEVMYGMNINKTTANSWYTGKKRDPFSRSAEACELMRQNKRSDLIASALMFITGKDFDSAVLQRVTELLQNGRKGSA